MLILIIFMSVLAAIATAATLEILNELKARYHLVTQVTGKSTKRR